jgi:hypothetical protein
MTTSDYLINAVFVLVVLRQARERQVSVRGLVAPLAEVLRLIATALHATAQAVRYAYRHGIA